MCSVYPHACFSAFLFCTANGMKNSKNKEKKTLLKIARSRKRRIAKEPKSGIQNDVSTSLSNFSAQENQNSHS